LLHTLEFDRSVPKTEVDRSCWSVAVLGNYDLSDTFGVFVGLLIRVQLEPFILGILHIIAIDKNNYIGILLDGAALPEVKKLRTV
jgi:hypothetical protein